jgi:hypothetical protein
MLDRLDPIKCNEESRQHSAIAEWVWNSHWWVEYCSGYYKCKWCGISCSSLTGITKDSPLCKENPAIKKLLSSLRMPSSDLAQDINIIVSKLIEQKEKDAIKKPLEAQKDKVYNPVVGYLSGTNLNLVPCPTCNALCVCTNKK